MSATRAFAALVFLTVGDDIPFSDFILVTTGSIRTKYTLKVHVVFLIA